MFHSIRSLFIVVGCALAATAFVRADEKSDKALLRDLLKPSTAPAEPMPDATAPSPATAAPGADDATMSDAAAEQLWRMYWFKIGQLYVEVDGKYYLCSNWDSNYPNSMHIKPADWQKQNTTVTRVSSGGISKTQTVAPPIEEATAAATSLPQLAPNQYGFVHSVKVEQVVGPTEMIVSDIELIDTTKIQAEITAAEQRGQQIVREQQARQRAAQERQRQQSQYNSSTNNDSTYYDTSNDISSADIHKAIDARYKQRQELIKRQSQFGRTKVRLIGYPTTGAVAGSRWGGYDRHGFQIALVAGDTDASSTPSHSRSRELLAVNADLFKKGATEEQFEKLLADRNMTRRDFAVLVRDQLKLTPGGFSEAPNAGQGRSQQRVEDKILAELEKARIDVEKAKAEAEAAQKGDKKSTSDRGGFLADKYGSKSEAADKNDSTEPSKDKKPSFLDQKYGDKNEAKSDDKAKADDAPKKNKKPSFLEQKYGNKNKDEKSDK